MLLCELLHCLDSRNTLMGHRVKFVLLDTIGNLSLGLDAVRQDNLLPIRVIYVTSDLRTHLGHDDVLRVLGTDSADRRAGKRAICDDMYPQTAVAH